MASYCVSITTIDNQVDSCFVTSTQNLTLNKGSAYRIVFKLLNNGSNVDLTGHSLRGQIRPSVASSAVLLEMSSANLLLNLGNSAVTMILPERFTRRVSQTSVVYDIELLNTLAESSKIITGTMIFIPEVTR
jgi:hypothetical protein